MEIRQSNVHGTALPSVSPERVASPAAAQAESQRIVPPAYMSPVIKVDAAVGLAVLVVRDGDSGDVKAQYPAKRVVQEYRSSASTQAQPPQDASAASSQPSQASSQPVATGTEARAPAHSETSISA